jgi:hypothetical protein
MRQMIHLTLMAAFIGLSLLTAFGQVEPTLDEETLKEVFLYHHLASDRKSIDFLPGQKHKFSLLKTECCVIWKEVKARVSWSVEPTMGAHIDPITGDFYVDATTPPGTVFTVKADVESGRRILTAKVYVYTPKTHPLVRIWEQKAEIACGTGKTQTPKKPIRELTFYADGTFSVTRVPIETMVDYWGTYTYDSKKGRIKFTVSEGGGYDPPADIDGEGSIELKDGDLILNGIWLGSRGEEQKRNVCGLIFSRPYWYLKK